ncbi:hypothetical protein M569_10372 [Genlisea aurea]|uniref:Uncharacterized protein n=1 Tax=Genlisea aurea TaxID=192259 RepID=S8CC12_9LAMI|nr:hypothetical protein M569_10372 [Genlisea aurea]
MTPLRNREEKNDAAIQVPETTNMMTLLKKLMRRSTFDRKASYETWIDVPLNRHPSVYESATLSM